MGPIGKESPLGRIDPTPGYWQDEIRYVLKGRGLTDFAEYALLPRLGRFRPLNGEQRAMVWNLYREYELGAAGTRHLRLGGRHPRGRGIARREPLTGYAAVIVDEAQDLSCAMIRMLHGLAGDSPDALTLVSDGQQTIYPGGYTLAEAGVAIQGRGVVLGVNYRSTAEIIEFAKSLVKGDHAPDIEGDAGRRRARRRAAARDAARCTPCSRRARCTTSRSSSGSVAWSPRTRTPGSATSACSRSTPGTLARPPRRCTEAGIPTVELEKWDGLSVDAVKVGTIKRSKGLEFKEVLVVRTPPHLVQADVVDPDEAAAERRLLQRRELYVAMTRAREGLWVGVA